MTDTAPGCTHPTPVEGVMAREFSAYAGARGPEGKRRTTMFYGPVVGGQPIIAWHCEECGVLRLSYPDDRKEERQLQPGPQPGLLAGALDYDPGYAYSGRQARVSGLSLSPGVAALIPANPETRPPRTWPWRLPDLDVADWISVIGLAATLIGLLVCAILAVYDYQTSPYMNEAVWTTVISFTAVIVIQLGKAAWHHFAALPGSTSLAETQRATPRLDGITRTVIGLLVVGAAGLLLGAILAVYDYSTPGLEKPVLIVTTVAFALALLLGLVGALYHHAEQSPDA